MKRASCVFVEVTVLAVVLLVVASAAAAAPKVEDCVTVQWSSVHYSKAVIVNNPKVSSNSSATETSETLTLSCQVEVGDPNRILGTEREGTITLLTDSKGREIQVSPGQPRRFQRYEGLSYRERFVPPEPVPKWKAFIRSVLRMQSNTSSRPRRVTELQPNRLSLGLDMSLLEAGGSEIRRIKGTFHVMATESIEHVDVPFEPNNTWVRLAPNQEIQVAEAQATGSSYRLRLEARPQGRMSPFDLSVGNPLPSRLVIDRQILGPDGKPVHPTHGRGMFPAPLAGSMSGSGGNNPATTIRFLIAVNPTHEEIPFELEHIPLPKP